MFPFSYETVDDPNPDQQPTSFGGAGSTLTGRSNPAPGPSAASSSSQATVKKETTHEWGSAGHTLGATRAGKGASTSQPSQRKPPPPKERSPTPDFGVDDDDDAIMFDSD